MSWDEIDANLSREENGDGHGFASGDCIECGEPCVEDSPGVYLHEDQELDIDHVCIPEFRETDEGFEEYGKLPRLKPNQRARTIKGPAMDTRFGDTIENPDEVDGTDATHLDAAMDRYETFHDKAPIRVAELEHDLPKKWVAVGDALSVMYRTDKWKKDGSDIDYKHLHGKSEDKPYEFRKGVRLYEPASEVRKSKVHGGGKREQSRPQGLPVREPRALTMLGYCLGFFVKRHDDEQVYEVNPRGCWLFSSPSGDMLALYSPHDQPDGSSGFLAVMAGGNLRVLKDGIDG